MKIKMMTLAAIFCCAMSSTMFTACGSDDDDDDNKNQVDDTKPVGAQMCYGLIVDDAMLSAFDLTIEYYDENSQLQTEKLTQEEWEKIVKATKLPASLGFRLKAKAKNGIDADFFQKHIGLYGFHYDAGPVNTAGKMVEVPNVDSYRIWGARFEFTNKELDSFLSQEDDVMISVFYDFSDKGAPVGEAWWTAKSLNIK